MIYTESSHANEGMLYTFFASIPRDIQRAYDLTNDIHYAKEVGAAHEAVDQLQSARFNALASAALKTAFIASGLLLIASLALGKPDLIFSYTNCYYWCSDTTYTIATTKILSIATAAFGLASEAFSFFTSESEEEAIYFTEHFKGES